MEDAFAGGDGQTVIDSDHGAGGDERLASSLARRYCHGRLGARHGHPDLLALPGEARTLTARWRPADAHGATPVVAVDGWNVAPWTGP